MTKKAQMELLIAHSRENPNWEAVKAKEMFGKFVGKEFSYDDLSNHPDYLVYASANVLAVIIPLVIDEMYARNDFGNYLIYPLISAVDPLSVGHPSYAERAAELVNLVDKPTADKILKFLTTMKVDPPITEEKLAPIVTFWENIVPSLTSSSSPLSA